MTLLRAFIFCAATQLMWFVATDLSASELLANFDSFAEGPIYTDFTDGGLLFSDLDVDLEGDINPFVVDNASSNPWLHQSLPNVLTFTGYSPGPAHGLGRFRSMAVTVPGIANHATIDAYTPISDSRDKAFVLSAYLNDVAVATRTFLLPQGTPLDTFAHYHALSIDAPAFDKLRLLVTRRGTADYVTTAFDNVRVHMIPEPGSLALFAIWIAGFIATLRGCPISLPRRATGHS